MFARRFTGAVLVAVICLPLALLGLSGQFLKPNTSDLNRPPTKLSWPTLKQLGTDQPFSNITNFLEDRVALRHDLSNINARINISLNDDPTARVVLGKRDDGIGAGNWLFLQDGFDRLLDFRQSAFDAEILLRSIESLVEVSNPERDFVFAIAPNKMTIYPEKLRAPQREMAELAIGHWNEFYKLAATSNVSTSIVNIRPALMALKDRGPDAPLVYDRRDTHWTPYGATAMAEAIVERFDAALWNNDVFVYADTGRLSQGLNRMAALKVRESRTGGSIVRTGVETTYSTLRADVVVAKSVAAGSDADRPKLLPSIVVLHDSFGEALIPVLAPWFNKVTFIHHRAITTREAKNAVATAQAVIYQIVERNIIIRGHFTSPQPWSKPLTNLLALPMESAQR